MMNTKITTPKFSDREVELQKKWGCINPAVPVNKQQHSFDTPERQTQFINAQFPTQIEQTKYQHYRSEWFRRAKEFDPGLQPLSVGIELVSTCNLNCSMCYTITDEFQEAVVGHQRMLPWAIVTQIIDEAAVLDVPSILFSWRGESTLYKSHYKGKIYRLPDAFAYAREKGILEITCLTNGQLIDETMAKAIVEAEPSWINISVDGLSGIYNKVRTPKKNQNDNQFDAFKLVSDNIKRLVEFRNRAGKTRPQIRTNTIYPTIANDPQAYFDYMKSIGVGWVTVNEILDFRGSGIDGEQLPDEAILSDWACQYPFQRLMISANGTIIPCTGAHNEEQGLTIGRYLGTSVKQVKGLKGRTFNVCAKELSLHEAWTSEKLNQIRAMHRDGKRTCITPGCRNCRHGAVKHGVTWIPTDWNMTKMEWSGHKFRNG